MIEYKLIISKRKSMAISLDRQGNIIARVPTHYNKQLLEKFILSHTDWLNKQKAKLKTYSVEPLKFDAPTQLKILDNVYIVVADDVKRIKIEQNTIHLPKTNPTAYLVHYLKTIAKNHLAQRVEQISQQTGLKYANIRISSAKSVWGSCSYKNTLNFTYKLMLCPISVVDYIIYHELTHTLIKNHSQAFWRKVSELCPNYKQAETWLKQNRGIVDLI